MVKPDKKTNFFLLTHSSWNKDCLLLLFANFILYHFSLQIEKISYARFKKISNHLSTFYSLKKRVASFVSSVELMSTQRMHQTFWFIANDHEWLCFYVILRILCLQFAPITTEYLLIGSNVKCYFLVTKVWTGPTIFNFLFTVNFVYIQLLKITERRRKNRIWVHFICLTFILAQFTSFA